MNLTDTHIQKFESKFHKGNPKDCWLWQGSLTTWGYGRVWVGKREELASRVSYTLYVGQITDGLFVLHTCDNPACVNPSHLYLGTHEQNMHDTKIRHRHPDYHGERAPISKLSNRDAAEIRRLYTLGVKQETLSRMFRVSRPNISMVVNNHTFTGSQ